MGQGWNDGRFAVELTKSNDTQQVRRMGINIALHFGNLIETNPVVG
jgi:hypothetical protein